MQRPSLDLLRPRIADFCRHRHIRKLAIFGSILRPDFRPESDIDILVEFEAGHIPGLAFFTMEEELSALLEKSGFEHAEVPQPVLPR